MVDTDAVGYSDAFTAHDLDGTTGVIDETQTTISLSWKAKVQLQVQATRQSRTPQDENRLQVLMKCAYPIILEKGRAVGCGQCVTCRINKRREWTNRIVLESSLYEDNTFVTLTFDDDNLPEDLSVSKRDLQLFWKKLRKKNVQGFRYFAVGEYGSQTHRPHYHAIMFGHPNCNRGITRYTKRDSYCCPVCTTIRETWSYGNVYLGQVSVQSASYVAGYVTKGWTRDIPLKDREPEFTTKSNRPGIGEPYCWELASSLLQANATHVPFSVRHSGKFWPLGRYIREKTSTYAGDLPLETVPKDQEVHDLSETIYGNTEIPAFRKAPALREALIQASYFKNRALKAKVEKAQRERTL